MKEKILINDLLSQKLSLAISHDDTDKNARNWEWEYSQYQIEIIESPLGVLKEIKYPEGVEISEDDKIFLENLFSEFIVSFDQEQKSGIEPSDELEELKKFPYDPKKIKINTQTWSVASAFQYLKKGIINLSPDFQRNFVWDTTRQSQLIESILLGIPVPAFYLAKSGKSHQVVDGLQRLTTIKRFMNNEFPLKNLEYLNDKQESKDNNLEGCFYSKEGRRTIGEDYEFLLTSAQLHFNIIEDSTPTQVKFDIFRRLNTGGKPLNNQEIRNCMMEEEVRNLVNELVRLFLEKTNNSVGTTRMNAHELVMRFIGFWYEKINKAPNVVYQGNMQSFLDSIVDQLNKDQGKLHEKILLDFENSIDNAAHLFGKYAFRKCLPEHLKPGARGQLVNKSLFTTWSTLLVQAPHSKVIDLFPQLEHFAVVLANELAESRRSKITGLSYYDTVSYRTNDRLVLETAFEYTQNLIEKYLIK